MSLRQLLTGAAFLLTFVFHSWAQYGAWQLHIGTAGARASGPVSLTASDWTVYSFPLFTYFPRRILTLHFSEVLLANSFLWAAACGMIVSTVTTRLTRGRRRRSPVRTATSGLVVAADRPVSALAPRPAATPRGEQFGDFRLLGKLAEGGMGVIYKAHQTGMDRDVALKILPRALALDPVVVERFQQEARLLAKVDHPNIVRGIASGQANGQHYFAMEFVDGEALDQRLERDGRLPVADAVRIAITVGHALQHAHSRGIVHRDIKPSNVIVARDGVVKLADLGVSKLEADAVDLTRTGQVFGTPAYMAPEQGASTVRLDPRWDIYALGATLYHLLTGRKPFPGKTFVEIQSAKERGIYEPASRTNSEVSPALDAVLSHMMAVDPEQRFRTAADMVRALEQIQPKRESTPPNNDPTPVAPLASARGARVVVRKGAPRG